MREYFSQVLQDGSSQNIQLHIQQTDSHLLLRLTMPSAVPTPPPLTKWQRPAKTKYDLDWADLEVINLSNFEQDKAGLAAQLRRGVHRDGFFGVTGTGLTDEEVNRQYSIAQAYFDRPTSEKAKVGLCCDFEKGNYFGYRGVSK